MPPFDGAPGLLEKFRAGSREAMETVYWAYVRRVEALVRRGFRGESPQGVPGVGPGDLEDLVQEIFAKAFSDRARMSFDGLRDYGPFLFTIARNVVVDWARKKGREVLRDDLERDVAEPSSPGKEHEPWADPETTRLAEAYLGALPGDLAAVHHERYVLGHTQREAADALGLSRQQLRTREDHLRKGLADALRARSEK
jgi:RNA polymerase sigma-70 factor (ECF subfamily)